MTQMQWNHRSFGFRLALGAIASSFLGFLTNPAQAQESFSTAGVQFNANTIIEFEFLESHGAYQSTFGVVNLDSGEKTPLLIETKPSDDPQPILRPSTYQSDIGASDRDFLGTPGNTVPNPIAEFEFKANTRYAFYLESNYDGRPAGIVYSTELQQQNGTQLVQFDGGIEGLGNQGTTIIWDDTGSVLVRPNVADRDFDDFVVRAGGYLACPYRTATAPASDKRASTATGQTTCQ